ncbi:hypothetical protein CK203_108946 [Vitis vinifera]|uniref:Uncharacterized protein n=1 Tax=Vitis vinifera TaxID=29760 RepID=A0A438FFP1_VITVI|nr:hypothetical protein CK203_108946 [Vitis vinifera]
MLKRRTSTHTDHEGPHASTSYACTIMYSATYRAASDPTTYYATSTYFPWDGKTNGLKRQISNFSAKENEKSMSVGRDTWKLSMLVLTMALIHGYCKNPKEAMDFLSYVAEVSRGWDESNAGEVGRMKSHLMLLMPRPPQYTQPSQALPQALNLEQAIVILARLREIFWRPEIHQCSAQSKN